MAAVVPSGVVVGRPRLGSWPLRGAPATTAYLLALGVTSATMAGAGPHAVHRWVQLASTNVHNLSMRPLYVLIVSGFWVETAWLFWPMAALLLAVMAPAERRWGTLRTVLVFAAGHVLATVLTEGVIAALVRAGRVPRSMAFVADVGPSYGLVALGAVLIAGWRRSRVRRCATGGLVLGLVIAVLIGSDVADAGHLVAALAGLALGTVLSRRTDVAPVPDAVPSGRRADRVQPDSRVSPASLTAAMGTLSSRS
jgi:Rhomboid family